MFSDGDELASDLTRQLRQATVMLKSAVLFSKELNIFKIDFSKFFAYIYFVFNYPA